MYEAHQLVVRAGFRLIAQELESFRLQSRHLRADVLHFEGHMVDAFAALVDRLGDGSIRRSAFQQFDLVRPYLEEGGDHAFALNDLALVGGNAQQFRIGLFRRGQVLHSDAQVFDADHVVLKCESPRLAPEAFRGEGLSIIGASADASAVNA